MKLCERCGLELDEFTKAKYCPDCADFVKRDWWYREKMKVLVDLTCATCGNEFQAYGRNAKYCPDCKAEQSKVYQREYRSTHKNEIKVPNKSLTQKELEARRQGKTYAELQKEQTLKMVQGERYGKK